MKSYGFFTEDGSEYVITNPHPPREWFNFFWNETYLACAGQHMNGFSLFQSHRGVVTNLFGKQDMRDEPRALFLRDRDTGDVWSASFLPCGQDPERFECRHGLGYSILKTESRGIEVTHRVFVPRRHPGEIWTIRLSNRSRKTRRISLFSTARIMLDGVNMPYGYLGGLRAEFLRRDNLLFFANTTHTVVDERYRAFLYADRKIRRWDVSLVSFLGPARNAAMPARVCAGQLGNSVASTEPLVGAVQHDVTLSPGASAGINLVLGVVLDLPEARRMARAFAGAALVEREFEAVRRGALARTRGLRLNTQDQDFNRLFNTWLKQELFLMADWARFYFKGYRDTCQDATGLSILNPARAMEMLRRALSHQRSDGFAPRAFRVPSMDIASADKPYADSPSWISMATEAILTETGDLSFLEERHPYSDRGAGTVWEHNLRAMEYLWKDRGAHGLSRIRCGDWNDLMDKVGHLGRGESVWMSEALAAVLRRMERMAGWNGDRRTAALCRRRHAVLARAIRRHGWEKDRFIAAINDDGKRYGSPRAREGRWFINAQSWAVLSGVVDAETYAGIARRMEPVVDTPVGPVHHWPPYAKYDPGLGQLSGTPPGFFTNGNVYCHAASFKIAADYEAGRADKAFDTLMRILPSAEKSEPYAQPNGYVGPTALRMKHHVSDDPWRTGTVAWNFLNVVERLLGFRRTFSGFHLRPQLPSKWKAASYVRPFRGTDFHITIRRGARPGLKVDGRAIAGDLVQVSKEGLGRRIVRIDCIV